MTHTNPPLSTPGESLLQRLRAEEDLLAAALATAKELHAALREGNLGAARDLTDQQNRNAVALHTASTARGAAAGALAGALGLPAAGVTLRGLAQRVPDELGPELLASRGRLAALTAELEAIQARNANLLAHLRSFFRGVLSDLTGDDTPARYGPSGQWLTAAPSGILPVRGNTR